MTTRAESAARTRSLLVDAGLRLAEEHGLAAMSVDLIVREAGVAKGSFFHHFGDRAGYLLALHRAFHERLDEEMAATTRSRPPGRDRLLAATTTYLDACLRDRGVRALLLDARAEPVIRAEVRARNARNATLCRPDFEAMSWPHPLEAAHLWVRLVAETAVLELDPPGPNPTLRSTLHHFLGGA
jgi:AcrR family transcriptional regulator